MKLLNSRKSGKNAGGRSLPGCSSWKVQAGVRIRKDEMDYLMIILPLKLALVIYIGYVLFH